MTLPKPPKAFETFTERYPKLSAAWELIHEAGDEGLFAAPGPDEEEDERGDEERDRQEDERLDDQIPEVQPQGTPGVALDISPG